MVAETLHYFAFAQGGNLTARMTTDPKVADTDGDTLSDGTEVNTHGSNPTLKDTDGDGAADNVEVTDRTITIPVSGTLKSFTFKTSPTSDDTDGDGIKDPDELSGILDHRNLFYDMSSTDAQGRMRDLSGDGNPGTIVEAADAVGQVGRARYFDGVNDYVTAADSPGLSSYELTDELSLSGWWKLDATPAAWTCLFCKPGTSAEGFDLQYDNTQTLYVWLGLGGTRIPVLTYAYPSLVGQWTHIAVTSKVGATRLYINGIEVKSVTHSPNLTDIGGALYINSGAAYWRGYADEIQFWDRGLEAAEVRGYYNLTRDSSLYYNMETLASGKMLDLSGKGNNGTIAGTTSVTGKLGSARQFSSASDYIQAADSPWLDPDRVTVAAWVNLGTRAGSQNPIVAKGQNGVDLQYYIDVRQVSTTWVVNVQLKNAAGTSVSLNSKTITASTWVHAAFTYNGATLQIYINGVADNSASFTGSLRKTTLPLRVGGYAGATTYFKGMIDEVQVWDRNLAAAEVKMFNDLKGGPSSIAAWSDLEARTTTGDLLDFGGQGHSGVATGTSVVEGKVGLGRKFSGGTDGISLAGTTSTAFSNGITITLHVLGTANPATDTSLVSRKGAFYLNMTSDGRIAWTMRGGSTLASPLPVALNRWVRIGATAGPAGLEIYVDGNRVASTTGGAPPSASTAVTLGYSEGLTHFVGSLDEIMVLSYVATQQTIGDLGIRGIALSPNATDTDFDNMPDGQELLVKTIKVPKRYPIPGTPSFAETEHLSWGLKAPGWAISRVEAQIGYTHPDMGQVYSELVSIGNHAARALRLKDYGEFRSGKQLHLLRPLPAGPQPGGHRSGLGAALRPGL